MTEPALADHRSRVAAERRERTRARLVESAMRVFAERGTGASVIQEVIAVAQVSQGTFYNYFRTNEELLLAVSQELNNELLTLIESVVGDYTDPGKRIASGVRLYLRTAQAFPLFARFVTAAGLHAAGPNNLIYEYLPPHIDAGQASGRFSAMSTEAALDLIAGTALAAVIRLATGEAPPGYLEEVVAAILRGLGVPGGQATKLANMELPILGPAPESLLLRTRDASPSMA